MSNHTPQNATGIGVPIVCCDGAVCIDENGASYVATAEKAIQREQRACPGAHFYTTIAPSVTEAKWWRERRYCPGHNQENLVTC